MSSHPVELVVPSPGRLQRVQVVLRLVLWIALGAVGYSSLYWLLYLCLPAMVALLVSRKGGEGYLAEDAPRLIRVLKWFASAYAYLFLLSDAFATGQPDAVELEVAPGGTPTIASSLLRLLYSLPALLLLALLSMVAGFFWLVGALFVLVEERLPAFIADFFTMTLRYQFRLFAYHLSLVSRYPSLSEAGTHPVATGSA